MTEFFSRPLSPPSPFDLIADLNCSGASPIYEVQGPSTSHRVWHVELLKGIYALRIRASGGTTSTPTSGLSPVAVMICDPSSTQGQA